MYVHVGIGSALCTGCCLRTKVLIAPICFMLDAQIFLRYSNEPVCLIAPVYKPFEEKGTLNATLGAPVLSFSAEVFTNRVPVDIYLVADPLGSSYFFLIDAEIFRGRTRGTIYTWHRWLGLLHHIIAQCTSPTHSEEEQLTFFSVFNQAAALVVQMFDIQRLQFHDYHGVLSLMYLPAGLKPEVLYVAHNAGLFCCTLWIRGK